MATIDVSRQVSELESVLRGGASAPRRCDALAVLERWQWDEMVDRESRLRARALVREFGSPASGAAWWGAPALSAPPSPATAPAAPTALPGTAPRARPLAVDD
jgi:hypothetical protein